MRKKFIPKTVLMNFVKSFLLFLLIVVSLPLSGANLYIQYDPDCMDRLEYVNSESAQNGSYVVYQIKLNESELLILEVGYESQRYQNYLPSQSINCSNAVYTKKMAADINSQIDRAFIVYQKGRKQYYVSPVSYAAYFVKTEEQMAYSSPQAEFQLNLKQGIIGENIALNRQRAEVFFDGRLENQCSGAYVFRQFSLYTSNPHMDIILVPEVGLVEIRHGRNADDALNNIRRLDKVNDEYLSDYMDRVCLGIVSESARQTNASIIYQPKPDPFTQQYGSPSTQIKGGGVYASRKKHVVKKKETLYGVAKQHNIKVDDIRVWNNLTSSNLIHPGDELWVSPPSSAQPAVQQPANPNIGSGGVGLGVDGLPAPYNATGAGEYAWGESAMETNDGQTTDAWMNNTGEHLVKPGETVASIANQYGYTENRLRMMNNLQPNEIPRIGRRLVTSDCPNPVESPSSYEKYAGNSNQDRQGSQTPAYENRKIVPINQSAFPPQAYETSQPNPVANRSTSAYAGDAASFDPYRSNMPSFYESPSTDYVRSAALRRATQFAAGSATSPTSYNNNNTTYNNTTQANTAPQVYDDTVPQGYDAIPDPKANQRLNRTLHFVREGQTLYDIAKLYNTTVDKLREYNQMGVGETIMPFQQIYVSQ